jgi:predicted  nucleic acid-binding Zn-ribbon protein
MIPVAVPHVKRDFTNALNARIEIRPDDTPEDIAAKQGVEQLKQEIKTLLDEGHALEDVIQVIQRERNTLAEYRRGVQQTLFQLVREGRMEEAATYQEAANQELSKENAAPLYVPDKLLEIGEQKAAAKQADP